MKPTLTMLVCRLFSSAALLLAAGAGAGELQIQNRTFLLDGRPYKMWGIRTASASQRQDLTDHLSAQLDEYLAHGVNTVAVYYQGSSGGYSDPFSPDGKSLEPAHQQRMEQLLRACDQRGMTVIVGIFYQRCGAPQLRDWAACKEAVQTVARALKPYRNLIINIANEQNSGRYAPLPWARVREVPELLELCRLVKTVDPRRLVGAGGYDHTKNELIGRAPEVDVLLFDTAGPESSAELYQRFAGAGVNKPMVNVETFGAWTGQFLPQGVFPENVKGAYFSEIAGAAQHEGLYLLFHNSPWCQPSAPGDRARYDLGGQGTAESPGIRWYFERVRDQSKQGAQKAVGSRAIKPNLVVFLADDHGLLDSQVYGNPDVRTPNMQRLAEAGIVFTRAFVASPSCAPSRAALLTGLMPARNGAEINHAKPRPELKKLPAYMKELGYEVVAFGKVSHYKHTKDYGFDYFAHDSFHEHAAIPAALKWLRERKSDKPLCIFVGSNWPHVPWPGQSEGYATNGLALPPSQVSTPETALARALYYSAVTRMDDELGRVYDTARAVLGTNTFFLHSSDHGAQFPFGKWNCYDAGIRTSLLVVWPGVVKPGTRTPAMVSWVDILPTLIETGGGKAPADLDGRSFLPVLRGERDRHRERIFTTHSADGNINVYPIRSVRTADWKYIRNLHPEFAFHTHIDLEPRLEAPGYFSRYWLSWTNAALTNAQAAAIVKRYHQRPREELYDLRNDPFETNNLARLPEQAERLKTFRAELEAWMREQDDKETVAGKARLLMRARSD